MSKAQKETPYTAGISNWAYPHNYLSSRVNKWNPTNKKLLIKASCSRTVRLVLKKRKQNKVSVVSGLMMFGLLQTWWWQVSNVSNIVSVKTIGFYLLTGTVLNTCVETSISSMAGNCPKNTVPNVSLTMVTTTY